MFDYQISLDIDVVHPKYQDISGTRSSNKWRSQPGLIDVLNSRYIWRSTNKFGIPDLDAADFIPDCLAAWNSKKDRAKASRTGAIHFFLDDYRFESIWRFPERYLDRILEVGAMLTPDFSIWRELPNSCAIWQTYRNRWIGALFQYHGLEVIPSVSWSDSSSYEYCFCGIPKNSVVAVSSLGVMKNKETQHLFRAGVTELIDRIEPSTLLCYGKMPFSVKVPVKEYPTFWELKKGIN